VTASASTSHLLGAALERRYQDVLLSDGPATEEGFYYDFATAGGKGAAPSVADLPALVFLFARHGNCGPERGRRKAP
jgi:hypothetical protein